NTDVKWRDNQFMLGGEQSYLDIRIKPASANKLYAFICTVRAIGNLGNNNPRQFVLQSPNGQTESWPVTGGGTIGESQPIVFYVQPEDTQWYSVRLQATNVLDWSFYSCEIRVID